MIKLSLNNQDIRRGERLILRGVSLQFDKAELVGIVGKNGSGKSSLLKNILDTIPLKERGKKISWLPQIVEVPGEYTVNEFLRLSRYPYKGETQSSEENAINKALSIVDMSDYKTRLFATLSGGERQRILIAGLLAQETGAILADEPTTFLDPLARKELFSLLSKIVIDQKKLVIIVTHDICDLTAFADRILVLKGGKVEFLPKSQLKDQIQEIYG